MCPYLGLVTNSMRGIYNMKAKEKQLIDVIKDAILVRLGKAGGEISWSKLMAAVTQKFQLADVANAIELLRKRGKLLIEQVGGKGSKRRGRPGRKLVLVGA